MTANDQKNSRIVHERKLVVTIITHLIRRPQNVTWHSPKLVPITST